MNKLKQYANSPAGKKKIKEVYGIDYEPKKQNIRKEILKKAEEMRKILYKHIKIVQESDDETRERMKSFKLEDIIIGKPQEKNREWQVRLYFNKDALKRESLYDEEYPEGAYDIILLLTKGYHADNYVYGWYDTGLSYGMQWERIRSLKDRDPDPFLANAVNEFNEKNASNAKAELVGVYK